MPFKEYVLTGTCKRDFNTEIRYFIASAKADSAELVSFALRFSEDEVDNSRLSVCVTKILSSMKKQGAIQFYIKEDAFKEGKTEADYIQNKYGNYVNITSGFYKFFVKLP